jgi:hypothetical protein
LAKLKKRKNGKLVQICVFWATNGNALFRHNTWELRWFAHCWNGTEKLQNIYKRGFEWFIVQIWGFLRNDFSKVPLIF